MSEIEKLQEYWSEFREQKKSAMGWAADRYKDSQDKEQKQSKKRSGDMDWVGSREDYKKEEKNRRFWIEFS